MTDEQKRDIDAVLEEQMRTGLRYMQLDQDRILFNEFLDSSGYSVRRLMQSFTDDAVRRWVECARTLDETKIVEWPDDLYAFAMAARREHKRRFSVDGYVYVLQSDSGYWKIGRSKNPANRLKTFNVKLPFMVHYEIVIPSHDYVQLELDLHKRFAYCRVRGEWFDLTDGDIIDLKREFKNMAEQYNEH